MTADMPDIGKISPEVFNELIFPRLGMENLHVLVGPQHGVDVGIVEIGNQAVALTADPVFIVPEYGWERAAWFAVHILASDVVTSGLPPTYLSIDLNLPMAMTKDELDVVWGVMDRECKQMGMAVVCGHTGRYENCHYPMVGGATVLAVGSLDRYVSPMFCRPGDVLIVTKGPAIEATGIFATMFPKLIAREYGEDFARQAESVFYQMSVVDDAMAAVSVGVRNEGVTAMHDATECGVWGGIYEMAEAARCGARVEKEKIVVEDTVRKVCELFRIDPYRSISEGTLIIACRPHKADAVVETLLRRGIKASAVGHLTPRSQGMVLVEDGVEHALEHPRVDPFWRAFYDALARYKDLEAGS